MKKAHTKEQFDAFMAQLQETNATLSFYSDFGKIATNVSVIEVHLNSLNYLIGKEDMEGAIRTLWAIAPEAFSVLEILIAVRHEDYKKVLDQQGKVKALSDYFNKPEDIIEYIQATGLKDVLQGGKVKNLVDYVFGIEVGLDSNARKNRSGKIMEHRVATFFEKHNIPYEREVRSKDLPSLNGLGEDVKRFDFMIKTNGKTYLIEVNFYSRGGSKPNEVARAYSELAPKVNANDGYEFVWITDGIGWRSAQNKLEEAFYAIPSVYNLTTLEKFVDKIKAGTK